MVSRVTYFYLVQQEIEKERGLKHGQKWGFEPCLFP